MLGQQEVNWRPLRVEDRHFLGILNSQFENLNKKYNGIFPNLRPASTILAASDYSGEAKGSNFVVFSFLLASLESWADWEPKRVQVRRTHLSNLRRMSFKQLGDKQRRAALIPLLDAASRLQGISFSVAVHKSCNEIFNDPPLDLSNPAFHAYRSWKPKVLTKAFFVIHILIFLLAGLGAPMQNVLWFTDEDSIAANDNRLGELTQLLSWIGSNYLPFTMGHIRCGTSRSDDGTRQLEDYLAIPDLIAGALSEQLNLPSFENVNKGDVFWLYRPDMSNKAKTITSWFSDISSPLKKIFCVIEPHPKGSGHLISCHHFFNQLV